MIKELKRVYALVKASTEESKIAGELFHLCSTYVVPDALTLLQGKETLRMLRVRISLTSIFRNTSKVPKIFNRRSNYNIR